MVIRPVGGDVVDVAPGAADAVVLWLRSGFNIRYVTWAFRIRKEYPEPRLVAGRGTVEHPWRSRVDSIWELDPPEGRVRHLYVLANPDDSLGYADLDKVGEAVDRALTRLADLQARVVALIHIPVAPGGRVPTRQDDLDSANRMVEAIRDWGRTNEGRLDEVLLVDRGDDFGPVLNAPDAVDG